MISFVLHVEPGQAPLDWESFCKMGGNRIALDGYVAEGPKFDLSQRIACFNHHEKVSRLETRATCAQVLMALRQGLLKAFRGPIHVYVNDCDEDVCLSWFLLKHSHLALSSMNPALNRLVHVEDMLDTTSGSYSLPESLPFLQTLAWIFAPYREARANGLLRSRNSQTFTSVIESVELRILSYLTGSAGKLDLDARYEKLFDVGGVAFVKEIGANARLAMFADGIDAFVSLTDPKPDGSRTCSVGRRSEFIPFSLEKFYELANLKECLTTSPDRWGGGSTTGGSPRIAGTFLSDEALKEIALVSVYLPNLV